MNRQLVDRLWLSGEAVPGAAFRLNDPVIIDSGEYAGHRGSVLSIESLDPEPVYLVELANPPLDAQIAESNLTAP